MRDLRRAPQFRRDVSDAWLYLAEEASPERADRFIDAVTRTIETIRETPGIGRPRPEFSVPGVRSFRTARRYLIYYRLSESGEIELLRLYHTSRDPDAIL